MSELKTLAKRLVNECLNPKAASNLAEFYTPDAVFHGGMDGKHTGHDALRAVIDFYAQKIPNIEYRAEELIEEGDIVVMRWTCYLDPTSKENPQIPGITILRYTDNLVSEIWQEWDKSLLQRFGY